MSRPRFFVATSVVSAFVTEAFIWSRLAFSIPWLFLCRDLDFLSRPQLSQHTSQKLLFGRDLPLASLGSSYVATLISCRDLNCLSIRHKSFYLVATSVVSVLIHSSQRRFIFWSRPLNDVATLFPCKLSLIPTLGTIPDAVLMSRPLLDFATSMFSLLKISCRDFYSVSRPPCLLLGLQFCRDLEMVSRHHFLSFINLWFPDLEFLLRPVRSAFNWPYVVTGVLWLRP